MDRDSGNGNEPRFVVSKERKFWKNCGALNHPHDLRNKCRWSRNSLAAKLATCPADTSVNKIDYFRLNRACFYLGTVLQKIQDFQIWKYGESLRLHAHGRRGGFYFAGSKAKWLHSGLDGPNLHKVTSMWAKTTQQLSCSAQVYMFAAVFFKLNAGYFQAKILHARKNLQGKPRTEMRMWAATNIWISQN